MSYKALIDSKLTLAFNKLKDLAEDVTFTRNSVASFDFATGDPVTTTDPAVSVKAVVIKDNKKDSTSKLQLLFKSSDVAPMSSFSTVTIDATVYRVGTVIAERNYITLLEVFKEA